MSCTQVLQIDHVEPNLTGFWNRASYILTKRISDLQSLLKATKCILPFGLKSVTLNTIYRNLLTAETSSVLPIMDVDETSIRSISPFHNHCFIVISGRLIYFGTFLIHSPPLLSVTRLVRTFS